MADGGFVTHTPFRSLLKKRAKGSIICSEISSYAFAASERAFTPRKNKLIRGGSSALAEHNWVSSELKVGMRLEMLSENQTPLFKGVISKKDDECIWVSHAEGSEVPPVVYNSRVRLKGYKKDDNILMLCGTVFGSTPLFWKIGQISEFSIFNKRENYRHPVSIVTTACRLPHKPGEEP